MYQLYSTCRYLVTPVAYRALFTPAAYRTLFTSAAYRAVEDLECDDAPDLGEQGEDDQDQEHPEQWIKVVSPPTKLYKNGTVTKRSITQRLCHLM